MCRSGGSNSRRTEVAEMHFLISATGILALISDCVCKKSRIILQVEFQTMEVKEVNCQVLHHKNNKLSFPFL